MKKEFAGEAPAKGHTSPVTDDEIPYSVILGQLGRKVGRFFTRPFRRGRAAQPSTNATYTELSVEDAMIQLCRKLPNKLTERRDRRHFEQILQSCRHDLAALTELLSLPDSPAKVVFVFAPHPAADKLSDGYAKRIEDIDDLLAPLYTLVHIYDDRTLVTKTELCARHLSDGTFYLKYNPDEPAHITQLAALVNRGRAVYVHSVLRVFPLLFDDITIPKILDVHGAVPEEATLNGNVVDSILQSRNEQYAIETFDWFVFVTNALKNHLATKYPSAALDGTILPTCHKYSLPGGALPQKMANAGQGPIHIIYSGGPQRWQMVDSMLTAMQHRPEHVYHIYTQTPKVFAACCNAMGLDGIETAYVPTEQIPEKYKQAHYGFVLREDITVNNVACPTKLTEYCAYGVVPILHTSQVGDFSALGMDYIPLEDFVADRLPSEIARQKMAENNLGLSGKLRAQYENGQESVRQFIANL